MSAAKQEIAPEAQAAINALKAGEPIGNVVRALEAFLRRQVIESYRSGLTLDQCAALHGLVGRQNVFWIIKRYAPDFMRPRTKYGPRKKVPVPRTGAMARRQIGGEA